jgi:GNAT superfamily N-acetyltransferase
METTRVTLRLATIADGPTLQHIERAAGEQFRDIGMAQIADDEPPSLERLSFYATTGRSWVATVDDEEAPDRCTIVGYCLADVVDAHAHLEQISVLPQWQGHGIARRLLATLRAWAASCGFTSITLTTFASVPWNAPLYEHLGFRVLTDDEIGPALRVLRDEESAHGLDPSTRVCMVLSL